MPDKQLQALYIPEDAQVQARAQLRKRLARQGVVSGGNSVVEQISLEPGERFLIGYFAGTLAAVSAAEVEELFDAPGIETVPFFEPGGSSEQDGYYSVDNVETEQPATSSAGLRRFDGTITKEGSRRSHYRAVETTATTESVPNSTTSNELVAIPDVATRTRWWDPTDGSLEDASQNFTTLTEHGTVAVYDANQSSIADPVLVYGIDYSDEWGFDCRVWDDRGNASKLLSQDGKSATQWQRVYQPAHQYTGEAILENDYLRLEPDEGAPALRAYEWDDANTTYSQTSLGSSDWEFRELDVTHIGLARIDGLMYFVDTASSSDYTAAFSLQRGLKDCLFYEPPNGGTFPSGLATLLDPILEDTDTDPSPTSSIAKKDEVDS